MPSMQERYTTELRDRDPNTVDVLFLDNSEGAEIAGLSDQLTNLTSLSMVNCQLKSFKGLPSLPSLNHLDVSNNNLGDDAGFDVLLKNAPELERLIMPMNNFTSIDAFRTLKMLPKLIELDISNTTSLGQTESYRDKIFEMIPTLKVLDGCNAAGEEVEEEYMGEAGEDSGDDDDDEDSGDDVDGPGLSYLDKSQFSDDETDDYKPKDEAEEETRGTKRSANGDAGAEPEAKKAADAERKTVSIFKQPVTQVSTARKESRVFNEDQIKRKPTKKNENRPFQAMWAKSLSGLRALIPVAVGDKIGDVEKSEFLEETLHLAGRIRPALDVIDEQATAASLCHVLHHPHSHGQVTFGQVADKKSLEHDFVANVTSDQPMIERISISQLNEDIIAQEKRVLDCRKRLQEVMKHFG
ncbi:unnamed protein product [Caenorhabditis bovis]|uniref:Uncharacterized protein n=1 Tax=Caenorhabditis bovis TaxID=2654633 RepID=A0A8S1FA76_9PELO|nr:unnamed protein product [Caenorhabditis bovis]